MHVYCWDGWVCVGTCMGATGARCDGSVMAGTGSVTAGTGTDSAEGMCMTTNWDCMAAGWE